MILTSIQRLEVFNSVLVLIVKVREVGGVVNRRLRGVEWVRNQFRVDARASASLCDGPIFQAKRVGLTWKRV